MEKRYIEYIHTYNIEYALPLNLLKARQIVQAGEDRVRTILLPAYRILRVNLLDECSNPTCEAAKEHMAPLWGHINHSPIGYRTLALKAKIENVKKRNYVFRAC